MPRFLMILGVSLFLNRFVCFGRCPCQVYVLRKAIAPLTTRQTSENGDFYLQNYYNYNISNSSFCPHTDPQHPPFSKKAKLLNGISSNCAGLPFWSLQFCVQKLVQVLVNCLYCTTDQPRMFINGVWT